MQRADLAAPAAVHDLTVPEPGSTTTRDLLQRYIRYTFARFMELPARLFDADTAVGLELARREIKEALRRDPGFVLALARRPTFGGPLHCLTERALAVGLPPPTEEHAGWARELCALVLFEMALGGVLPDAVTLPYPVSRLSSASFDLLLRFDGPTFVRFERGAIAYGPGRGALGERLSLPPAEDVAAFVGARVEHPYPGIRGGVALALFDNNPISHVEAHPEKHGNAVDLGEHPVEEWLQTVGDAFDLVSRYLPEIAAEMELVLHQIVPVGYHAERHFSASFKESVGTVYMSLHPNLMTMTEALIHEYQHNKLALLFHLDPILKNGFFPLFKSPVRPDPRPLHGVLLAVHAFQPVARLYEAMFRAGDPRVAGPEVARRYAQVKRVNRNGCAELLPNADPTPVGRTLLDEIARWDRYFEEGRDGVPPFEGELDPPRDPAEH